MLPPRGYVFIGLNVVRALSIIALLLVFSSSIVVMAHDIQAVNHFVAAGKGVRDSNSTDSSAPELQDGYIPGSTVPNQPAGAFWAVLNRLLIIGQVVVLLLSEFGWPASFFDRFFPVLGQDFGVGALGIIQCLIGAAVLSHHVDEFALVAAFFLFSIGCLNMVVGLIWRQSAKSKRSILSWREKRKDVLPSLKGGLPTHVVGSSMSSSPPYVTRALHTGGSYRSEETTEVGSRVGLGFGRQGEKAAALKGFMVSRPSESLPRYMPKATASSTRPESVISDCSSTAI